MTTTDPKEKSKYEMDRMKARGFEPLKSIREMPHIKVDNLGGRMLPLYSLYDHSEGWYSWIVLPDGRLQPMMSLPVESMYFSTAPAHPDDYSFPFVNFAFQRASWKNVANLAGCIMSDLRNLGTSLAKLRLIFENRPPELKSSRMAATEIEYIFLACRSLLDLLQATVSELWPSIRFTDGMDKKPHLPRSFADMVLKAKAPMTAEQIAERHKVPPTFAAVYAQSGEFLQWFRDFRDGIAHHGRSVEIIFEMEDGYGVRIVELPFAKMPIWSEKNLRPNSIGSLHAAACYVISSTLNTFDRMTDLLLDAIQWPPPLAPDHILFACGPYINELSRLDQGIHETPWYVKPAPEAVGAS